MLATSPVFRGFSINFSNGHGLSCLSARRGAWWLIRIVGSTLDPYLNYPGRAGCARRVAFLRILTFTGVHDLSRYVERQGQAV